MSIKLFKKGFTLVEVIVSISILGLLFTFLTETISTTKKLNHPYIKKSQTIDKESKIFNIIVKDISQIIGKPTITYGKRYDMIRFQTKNTIYNIIEPYITYFVSKKDFALVRTESLKEYNLNKKNEIYETFIYGDILLTDAVSFKVFYEKDFIYMLLRAKGINPIVLKLQKVQ